MGDDAVETSPRSPFAPEAEMFARLLDSRYSCRAFLPDPIGRSKIEQVLGMAQRTASWCNAQPWKVIVTAGAGTERFRRAYYEVASANTPDPDFAFPREYRGVYLERRRESGMQLYRSVGVDRKDFAARRRQELENFRFFGAPHVAVVTTDDALGIYGAIDCGAYVNNFMLAARSLGLSSIAQAALAVHSGFVRRFFGLPEDRRVVCGISFGYEDAKDAVNRFRTGRAGVDEVVAWFES